MTDISTVTNNLQTELIRHLSERGLLGSYLFEIDELMQKWDESAPQYMIDAVPEFEKYPMAAIAWAFYFGMAAAVYWDSTWDNVKDCPDLYKFIRDKRGFDVMDDYILEEILCINNQDEQKRKAYLIESIQSCSDIVLSALRHSGIEPGTKDAFLLFTKSTRLMYHLGMSVQMHAMGYKYEKN